MANEEKWLCEETQKLYERLPDRAPIRQFYFLAHGSELPRVKREKLLKEWKRRFGDPDAGLQRAIDLIHGNTRRSRRGVPLPVPNQLPARGHRPLGRDGLIHKIVEAVRERQDSGNGSLIVLSGMAGIGKSTIAHHVAWILEDRFPDGVLYANLRGFTGEDAQPADPEHVLDRFLAELPPYSSAAGLDGKSAALRSALAHRSVLIVLDDALSAKQVLPLLPGVGTSAVLITSRKTLGDLRSHHEVDLRPVGPLGEEAALELLQEKVSVADRGKHAQAFTDLARLCCHLPLALIVVARRLENRPHHTVDVLARELAEEREKLNVLHLPAHELSVRMALNCSVRALSEEARRLLWQLAVHPGPSIGWDAVMDLGMVGNGMRADRAVEELATANLVELRSDRYRLHDLVRAFARHYVVPVVPGALESFEKATVLQVLEHQLQNVRACDRLLDGQRMLPIGEPNGITVAEPEGLDQAVSLLDEEYDTVLLGIRLAVEQGLEHYMWLLPMALVTYQWRRRRLADALRGLTHATEAAESDASPVERAMFYRMLAGTQWRLEAFEPAANHLRRAILLSEQDDSEAGLLSLARSLHALALTLRKQGCVAEAEEHHRRALVLYRELSDLVGEAATLNGIGTLHYDQGEYDEALRFCADALGVVERTTDLSGRADVLYTLAKIHQSRAERNEALLLYRRACENYRQLENWPNEDKVLWLYADVLVAAGRSPDAVEALERVLVLRERMGGAGVHEVRDRLEGLR
ncbi:tetratricopeptide repeat protein [Streptomyces sp. NBC_00223]|uniref:tetratricopeptide repeat protein n=1 Tax=Streptomyces sp. NBC_00223 TaxID=2976008 RepID=UPI002E296E42|nr:tetratricopeptide repeat protein [Streptomyces sp. NBC_00223]